MDTREKDIEKLKDYKYGFSTDIENIMEHYKVWTR